jgi:hypothetical protein
VVSVGKRFHHAIARDWLLASDARPVLEAALDRLGSAGPGLASRAGFVAARSLGSGGSLGFAWADVDALAAAHPGLRAEEAPMEPAQALLAGGARQALLQSPWLAATLAADGAALSLSIQTAAKPAQAAPVFLPRAVPIPNIRVPRQLGSLVLRRDVEAFWRDHEGLVAAEFDAEFAKFNSIAGAIFGVRKLDEEVLPHLAPVAQLVAARQTYSGLASPPKIRIPGFALILQENDANKKVSDGFRRAFQTAVALASADRAQKEKMALGLSEESRDGARISYATFPDPEGAEAASADYNYSPAFFAKGTFLVFSTTLELARDLAAALPEAAAGGGEAPPGPRVLDALELWGGESGRALAENFEAIVAKNILEKGQTRAQAQRDLRGLTDLVSLVSSARAEIRERESGLELAVSVDTSPAEGAAERAASRPRQVAR